MPKLLVTTEIIFGCPSMDPAASESLPMPTRDCVWLHHDQGGAPLSAHVEQ